MFKVKVHYEDTDAAGIVYYANYLKYLERARTELLITKGLSNNILKKKFNILLVVKSCNIDFIKPAYLEDNLHIETSIDKISKVQIFLSQKIFKNNVIILNGIIRIAIVSADGKVCRLPKELLSLLITSDKL